MKTTITTKHMYLSGWTTYDMTWKTDFSGVRNITLQSTVVACKEPFSTKILKEWALEQNFDIEALFTDIECVEEDGKKVNNLIKLFNDKYSKNLVELNNQNKCYARYTATLNPNYKPLRTAFETIQAYDVEVTIEFKSGVINITFPSQGRTKESTPFMVFSEGKLVQLYEEDDAIFKIKCRIEKYLKECDSDEKFNGLCKQLVSVKKDLMKCKNK